VKKTKTERKNRLMEFQGKGAINSQAYTSASPVLQAVKKEGFYRVLQVAAELLEGI
jgi:hypothetical protein